MHVRQRADPAVFTGGDHQTAPPKLEIQSRLERPLGFGDQIPAGNSGIGGAVGDELGNVLCADEDRLEFSAERRRKGAFAAAPDLEPGVVEKLAALLFQAAFVGKRYSEHEVELDR